MNALQHPLIRRYWPYALLSLAALCAYSNIFNNSFLFDDEFLIVKNAFLRNLGSIPTLFITSSTAGFGGVDNFYRPLQLLLYVLTFQIAGLSPPAFHILNLLLHIINVCLIFRLAEKLEFKKTYALAATALWALHPLHVEAVTYMSATADTLHVTFLLSACLAWLSPSRDKSLYSLGFFILALLSKESAIVLPPLLISLTFLNKERFPLFKNARDTWPLWLAAILYLVLRSTLLDFDNTYHFFKQENDYTRSFWVRLLTFFSVMPDYASLLFYPSNLHFERALNAHGYITDPPVLAGIVLLSLLAVVFAFCMRQEKTKPLAWGLVWFFVAYFPCTGLIIPVNSLLLEHWMYLPSIGLFLGAAQTLANFLIDENQKIVVAILAVIATVLLGLSTYDQNRIWATPISLYTNTLKYEEGSARLHNNLAMEYSTQGQNELALTHYKKAIALWDIYPQTHSNLGNLLATMGHLDEAIAEHKRALELDPTFFRSALVLEKIYRLKGDKANAQKYHDLAQKIMPRYMPVEDF